VSAGQGPGLRVNGSLTIPDAELDERFTTSGGPGGQHANRSSTRVVLTFDVASSVVLTASQRRRMLDKLGAEVRISVDDARSQYRNREVARERMAERLRGALVQARSRRPTKPSRSAKARRLNEKKRRSEVKQQRRRPTE